MAMRAEGATVLAEAAYLLTWNPAKWPWRSLLAEITILKRKGSLRETWGCGVNKSIVPGSRLYLMRLGRSPKGIMGSGWAISRPYEALHWDENKARRGVLAIQLDVELDQLAEKPILPLELLAVSLPAFQWTPQSSGIRIPPPVAEPLRTLWIQMTASLTQL